MGGAHKKTRVEEGRFGVCKPILKLGLSARPHPLEVGVPTCPPPPPSRTRIARLLCGFIRPPMSVSMSVSGAGLARPEVTRKFAVGSGLN